MATEKAMFAGGCFWCLVKPFDKEEGIIKVLSGYSGGDKPNPTYEEVCLDLTGHYEVVEIEYDPEIYPYEKILDKFWRIIDPTDEGGQFFDRGSSYRTAIFYNSDEQKRQAEKSKADLQASGKFNKNIVTPIIAAKEFYIAEEYHQYYYRKNPVHYERYALGSGRADFQVKHWGNRDGK
ncbi:peptide methionine sulfoxide reductase MsrA [Kurthia zopfii]|uniref:Peptide methionine sulfoxide reductase MsrA n=1 Tax=Kurthia zopfii TaxID=1650 RepID=A0A2U3AB73_9BACL|nr:peptide-methionine (S)-S-oxide reductase MsrA [Kurthia zopfii]PWI21755.1 peptide-methionine (S)-S-oxide reductase [Kurthia zopfii]TDR36006.1 peptide-methionine (S)-S-oxide reductase [Kurthia zopfii]STX09476.1 Peptide methionine sulfoxide reductase MsrA [Kurthia zopfii]VEI06535.1 Peptide methionine sulfoxide reductase MsrA [Kurthia zopfii]GEK31082.1 peptide methionine sulfoxide reductase MsrA [Kurthia zopfii]